jgi:tetratricopeptide (TPR) repeat protein
LAGNLFYDGRYLPKDLVKTVKAFGHFSAQGDNAFANKDWQQALANYNQALALAAQEKEGIDQESVFAIAEKKKQAQFNTLLRSGDEFIKLEKWVLATDDLEQALSLAKELTTENKAEIIATITTKLAEIAVATAREQGDIAFAEEQWRTALDHYKNAYDAAMKSAKSGDPLVDEIRNLMVKAELYETINSGKKHLPMHNGTRRSVITSGRSRSWRAIATCSNKAIPRKTRKNSLEPCCRLPLSGTNRRRPAS